MKIQWITKQISKITVLAVITTFTACGGGGSGGGGGVGSTSPPADTSYLSAAGVTRTWLSQADLVTPKQAPASPLHNSYFMPIGTTGLALQPFSGTLHFTSLALASNASGLPLITNFPNIDLRFVSDAGDLIPLDRNILSGTNTSAQLLLQPGSIWSESADNGWSRASFPFEILFGDATYNGLATFLYKDDQVSSLRLQTVQSTAPVSPYQANAYGTLALTYSPTTFPENGAVVAQYRAEKASYLPVQPWSAIETSMQVSLSSFNDGINSNDISFSGIVKNGVIYRDTCHTQFGDYPYCQQVHTGAYSSSKSLGAAVALLRLAKKYGDGVGNLLIKDYVTVTATHNGWDRVTFLDALNMATGIGDLGANTPLGTGQYMLLDDDTPLMNSFFAAPTTDEALRIAFTQGKFSWGPGVEARYNNMHTYILGAAMDGYLKSKEGRNAKLWDMVEKEVYQSIGVAHAPMHSSPYSDGSPGLPDMCGGFFATADSIAKISMLLQNDGQFEGQQILSPTLTKAALYKTQNQGLRGDIFYDNSFGQNRYLMSFWSQAWSDGNGCNTRVPFMSGGGGNEVTLVALLPNGATAFRFQNAGNHFSPDNMISAAAHLGGMCPP